ncbi:MAG: hypothetical protein KDD82_16335, partial [Planctomycetes bacterium]|nr:hypothetical protein [Planctomycetota bacterium]
EQGLTPSALLAQARTRLERDPQDLTARVAEAAGCVALGDHEGGRNLARRVLDERPEDLVALHVLARADYQAERFPEVASTCARARELDPSAEFSYLYPCLIALAQGEFERCVALADEGLVAAPDSAGLWAARGDARLALDQRSQALEDFNASLARLDDPRTRLSRAAVFLRLQRSAEALEDLEAIQGPVRETRAWRTTRIQCLLTLDRARALQEARALQAESPDRADANFLLGEALRRKGDAAARGYLERAVQVEPGSPWGDAAGRVLEGLRQGGRQGR